MSSRELLALLLPPTSYSPNGERILAELEAEGRVLDAAKKSAARAQDGVTPFFSESFLPDWERICGITPKPNSNFQARLQIVQAKLAETGGLSIPYFIRLAYGMGYDIEINEPQEFRAGESHANEKLWMAQIHWVWEVLVKGASSPSYRFRSGRSAAGERLTNFGDVLIETIFEELKPAHTFVYFAYQE